MHRTEKRQSASAASDRISQYKDTTASSQSPEVIKWIRRRFVMEAFSRGDFYLKATDPVFLVYSRDSASLAGAKFPQCEFTAYT